MSQRRSFSYIYNVQRIILLVFYTTTAIALSIPLARLISILFTDSLFPLVVSLVLYMVGVVVIGSFIHVVSYIPFNLASAFDPIKNDIASGQISGMEQLGKRITLFTTTFFDFSFIDIEHAAIQLGDSPLISHEEVPHLKEVLEGYGIMERSSQMEQIVRAGKITINHHIYQLYILPLWFGEQHLGYMAIVSRGRISLFFQKFLMEYENNFLDDQIMIMKQLTKTASEK